MRNLLLCFVMTIMSTQNVLAMGPGDGRRPAPFPAPGGPGLQSPQTEEERKQEEDRRREEQRRSERAQNASASRTISAVGYDDIDCLNRANDRARTLAYDVIQECERQTEGLMSCGISAQRTSQYPRLITPVVGSSKYDERKSDEATCRASSISRAENSAVSACLVKYGVSCNVTSRGTVSDYHTETRRRYFIFGPRDLHQICKAAALAEPSAEYRVQCSVEIVARSNGRR